MPKIPAFTPPPCRVRLTRPRRTAPGPHSTNSVAPMPCSTSSVSRQRTGLSRFSASSARMSAKGSVLPLESTGKAVLSDVRRVERRAQRVGGGRHERRVEGAADVELAGAQVDCRPRCSTAASICGHRGRRARSGRGRCRWRRSGRAPRRARRRRRGRRRAARPCRRARARRPRPSRRRVRRRACTASSKSIAPAAVSAAYSPSEWPAAASGVLRSPAVHWHIEQRNSAGWWLRVPSARRSKGSNPSSSIPRRSSGWSRWGSSMPTA